MPLKSSQFVDLFISLGGSTYEDIPTLLELARDKHRRDLPANKDFEQSWRSVKGRGLERVIKHILASQLKDIDLELVSLKEARDLLQVDFGEYGKHYPDVDLVVIQPT